jgi:Holliday junction resolvase RusA-like endonuclease
MNRLVIFGPPRTKKTSNRIVRVRNRLRIIPSKAHEAWEQIALPQLRQQWHQEPLTSPVAVRARVYRERAVGDLVNYLQAVADALEHAGVVANDRLIESWDGSRLALDKLDPRTEIELNMLDSVPENAA